MSRRGDLGGGGALPAGTTGDSREAAQSQRAACFASHFYGGPEIRKFSLIVRKS